MKTPPTVGKLCRKPGMGLAELLQGAPEAAEAGGAKTPMKG
jgi:hypothetical protein